MSKSAHIARVVGSLWRGEGGPSVEPSLIACPVSGNNRVFVARAEDGRQVIAKVYFPVADGEQDRLDAEWDFLTHAETAAKGSVPSPIARDRAERVALYSFIEGRKLTADEVGPAQVRAAAEFIIRLNDPAFAPSAFRLRPAREACFSIDTHLAMLDRRIARLDAIPRTSCIDLAASEFAEELRRFWDWKKADIMAKIEAAGWNAKQEIVQEERLLSPSDFGFHNTLADEMGRLAFIDFEYAGWDDVAKLVADFFYQPAIPVSRGLTSDFLEPILARFGGNGEVLQRIALLHPIFGVKWCCIMLNRFLPNMVERAAFADPNHDADQCKREQIEKARHTFDNLVSKTWLM